MLVVEYLCRQLLHAAFLTSDIQTTPNFRSLGLGLCTYFQLILTLPEQEIDNSKGAQQPRL